MTRLIKSLLHLNGWVAVLIGSFTVINPVSMLASYGLQSDLSAALLSELRAPGGLLTASGLAIVQSSLSADSFQRGLTLSVMVYGSYGSVRVLGILLDGIPATEILMATAIELTLCVVSIIALTTLHKRRRNLMLALTS